MERVIAEWDVAVGTFIVSEASIRGLAGVRGETPDEFNAAVRAAIESHEAVEVQFPDRDEPVLLAAAPH